MRRCTSCGVRVAGPGYSCVQHGVVRAERGTEPPHVSSLDAHLPGFALEKTLGYGGYGEVRLATRLRDGLPAAVKIAATSNARAVECLRLEAQALRAIGPPTVPEVYDEGQLTTGEPYVAMELLRLLCYADWLTVPQRPSTPAQATTEVLALLEALAQVHARGYLHGDLKPENLFLDTADHSRIRLLDFGLARRLGEREARDIGAGTAEYMSPEQIEGASDLDERSDLYAVGVILHEALVGAPPFWGTLSDVKENHRSRRPSSLVRRGVPEALNAVVLRSLAKDRERRFPSATEFARALQDAVEASRSAMTAATMPAPASSRPGPPGREKRTAALVFFQATGDLTAIKGALATSGGELVHIAGSQQVALFGHEAGENPIKRACDAARTLHRARLCARAVVDLGEVTIHRRPDGARRYMSNAFTNNSRHPSVPLPEGLYLTSAAAELVPELEQAPCPERAGWFRVSTFDEVTQIVSMVSASGPSLASRASLVTTIVAEARAATQAGVPSVTTVIGAAGFGKSHLAHDVLKRLRSMVDLEVIALRAREPVDGDSARTLRALLALALDLPTEVAPADRRTLLSERLGGERAAELWTGVAFLLGWVDSDDPEIAALANAPGALRSVTAHAAGDVLRSLARRRPVALVLDDAHQADEILLDALEFATLHESHERVWLCVLARPSFEGRKGWADKAAVHHRHELAPLTLDEAMELCRSLLQPAEGISRTALERLAARGEGSPLVLSEICRGLHREGAVKQRERGSRYYLDTSTLDRLPDLPLVQWMAARETEALPVELAAHARLMATLGAEVGVPDLEGVVAELERAAVDPGTQLDSAVAARRLVEAGMLVRHRDHRLTFRHAALHEAVYRGLAPEQRSAFHAAAYRFYAGGGGIENERTARVAFHAARAGQRTTAASAYASLARAAADRHAYLEAELQYGHTLENLEAGDLLARAHASRGRGLMRFRLSRYDEALSDLAEARALAQNAHALEFARGVMLDMATVLDWCEEHERSRQLVDEVAALAPPDAGELERARIQCGRGRSLYRQGAHADAVPLFLDAIARARPLGDAGYETMVIAMLLGAVTLGYAGRFAEAAQMLDETIAVCTARKDPLHLAAAHLNRFVLWIPTEDVPRMIADLARVQRIAREEGVPLLEWRACYNLTETWLSTGNFADGEREGRRSLHLAESFLGRDSAATFQSQLQLARLLVAHGCIAEARHLALDLRARIDAAQRAGKSDARLSHSDEVLWSAVELATRDTMTHEWDALLVQSQQRSVLQETIEVMELKALHEVRMGRREQAQASFEATLRLVETTPNLMKPRVQRHWRDFERGQELPRPSAP